MSKKLIIPIEIKRRELDAAVNMSIKFLKNNWTVYLGQKQQMFPFIKDFSRSVWFLKSIVPGENSILMKLKKNNHFISSLDVEGLVPSTGDYGVFQRYDDKGLNLSDIVFFWGKRHYNNLINVYPQFKKKYFITGSPISDVWKKKYQLKKNKFPKILFIGSFPLINNKNDAQNYFNLSKSAFGKNLSKKNLKILRAEYDCQKKSFKDHINFIEKLISKDKYDICIRPHPIENANFWENFISKFKSKKKIYVDNHTDLNKQILESDIVIHFNSTVSVQSTFNKKKTFMMYNNTYKKYYSVINEIPLKLSSTYKNYEDFAKKVKNKTKKNNYIKKILYTEKNKESSDLIYNVIEKKFSVDGNENTKDPFNLKSIYSLIVYNLKKKIAYLIALILKYFPITKNKFEFHLVSKSLGKQKWSELKKDELLNIFSNLSSDKKILRLIKIEKHLSGIFRLSISK